MAVEVSVDLLGVRRGVRRPVWRVLPSGGIRGDVKTQWIDYFYRRWASTLARWNWSAIAVGPPDEELTLRSLHVCVVDCPVALRW